MIDKNILIASTLFFAGCAWDDSSEVVDRYTPEEYVPEVITYNATQRVNVVDAAIARWVQATCLDISRVDSGSPNSISFVPKSELPQGLTGHTGGRWDAARIRVKAEFRDEWATAVLTHEMFHHLAQTNGHTSTGVSATGNRMNRTSLITAEAIELVCLKHDCNCFNPEN